MKTLSFILLFIFMAGQVLACDYCIEHPGEKELRYQERKSVMDKPLIWVWLLIMLFCLFFWTGLCWLVIKLAGG